MEDRGGLAEGGMKMEGGERKGRRVGKKTRERERCGRGEGVGRGKLRKRGWERNLLSAVYTNIWPL